MQISFNVNGQKQLSRNLRMVATKISNMQSFFEEGIDIIHDKSNQIFEKQGSNVEKNPKWQKLKSRTEKARDKRWGYYKKSPNKPGILRWTGRLQEDITKEATKKHGILRYNAPYAIYHQQGSSKLPQRAIIDLDNGTNTKIIKALQKKINDDTKIFGKQL